MSAPIAQGAHARVPTEGGRVGTIEGSDGQVASGTGAAGTPSQTGSVGVDALRASVGRPGGLTAEVVARRAATTSAQADVRFEEVRLASSEVDRAKLDYYPRLTFTGRYTRLSDITAPTFGPRAGNLVGTPGGTGPLPPGTPLVGIPSDSMSFPVVLNQYFLQANLTVPLSDYALRTSESVASAYHSRKAAELNERSARELAAYQGKLVYYDWVRAKLRAVVAEQALERSQTHERMAEAARVAGRLLQVEVLRARSQVAAAELTLERATQAALLAEDRLRTLMHDRDLVSYEIGEDPLQELPELPDRGTAELYAEATRQRLELRALDAAASSLRARSQSVAAGNYPRLDAFGNAYYANPNPRYVPPEEAWHASWDVGLQVRWSPNDWQTTAVAIRGIEARAAELAAQQRAIRDAVRGEMLQARQALHSARVALAASSRGLTAAEEAYRGRVALFEMSRSTTVELIDAESELLRARLAVIDAHVDLRVARTQLDRALGTSPVSML